jgi:competence protein ComEC
VTANALAALVGASLLLQLRELPGLAWLLGVACAGLLAGLLIRKAWPLVALVAFGAAALAGHARLDDRLDPQLEGETLDFAGVVASVPERSGEALRFVVRPADRRLGESAQRGTSGTPSLPSLVELTWYEPEFSPLPGERMHLSVRLRTPRGFANPGGSDREAQLLRERIGATGYLRELQRLDAAGEGGIVEPPLWLRLRRAPVQALRGAIAARIEAALGERPATGIVQGLAVGLQDALSDEQWSSLSRSGTSHLMAVSGLHIGMLAMLGAALGLALGRLRLRLGLSTAAARDLALVCALLATLAYALLAGWSVPTQRTAIMIGTAALALRLRRAPASGEVLALALLAVLLLDPLAPLAIGFWLSFGAVLTILLVCGGRYGPASPAGEFLRTQLAVTLGLAPVLALGFGGLSLVSIPVNLVAVPLYTLVVVPWILVATALAFAWPAAGDAALAGVAWLIETTWPVIALPASWELATWHVASLPVWLHLAMALGALACLLPLGWSARVGGAAIVLAACLARPPPPAAGHARLTVLDVGQGLAIVVETHAHGLVYDAGPAFRSGRDTGQLAVLPFLRARGLRRLDRLVVSHDDLDHVGGARSVAEGVPVARIQSGQSLAHLASTPCRAGERWTWDGVRFSFLHPGAAPIERDNDASCVLLVETSGARALVTGDIEAPAEAQLIAGGALPRVDLLVSPHHGSRTSSTARFVLATRPGWVVHSIGHRNRWGFPKPAVVERWHAVGAEQLDTARSGAVSFDLGPLGLSKPQEWRAVEPRWWRSPAAGPYRSERS